MRLFTTSKGVLAVVATAPPTAPDKKFRNSSEFFDYTNELSIIASVLVVVYLGGPQGSLQMADKTKVYT